MPKSGYLTDCITITCHFRPSFYQFLCHFPIVLIKNFHKERLFLLTIMFTLDTFFFNSSFMCQARTIFPLSIPYFCLIIKINRRTMTKIKEEHSFQRVRLMKQAAAIRQNNGMNRHDALVTAHPDRRPHPADASRKCPLPLHQTRRQRPPRHRHTHRIRTQFPPTLYSTTGKHVRRLLRHRGKRMAHVPCGKLSGHRR